MGTLFDRFMGLPVHPLVDHFAVVLFPLALLMLLAIIAVRAWRGRFGWLTLLLLTVGTAFVLAAKESGEQLARHIGEPHDHAQLGDILTWVALPTWVVTLVWFGVDRAAHLRARRASAADGHVDPRAKPAPSAVRGILAGVAAVGAIASLVLTAFVGHTGAKAVWGGVVDATSAASSTPSSSPSSSPSASSSSDASTSASASTSTSASDAASASASTATPSASDSAGASASSSASSSASTATTYTLAQIAQHNTSSSCWAAINGNVYDLTKWINQHPGGPEKITQICGTDGSSAFNAQHAGDSQPQQDLAQFLIGTLG